MNSTWLITSKLANQCAPKALFTCVVYTNNCHCIVLVSRPPLKKNQANNICYKSKFQSLVRLVSFYSLKISKLNLINYYIFKYIKLIYSKLISKFISFKTILLKLLGFSEMTTNNLLLSKKEKENNEIGTQSSKCLESTQLCA